MEHGLVSTTASTTSSETEMQATTAGDALPGYSAGGAGPSHLDSFIDSSGWTREDLLLLTMVLNVALVASLVYMEVSP